MTAAAHIDRTVTRIAVFRALMLGDLLCAVPTLRALRAGFPDARIALVGLPWARGLADRLACIDEFVAFPGWPGLPEAQCDVAALPDFVAAMQARREQLAIQLHGSGVIANPLVALFGAGRCAGFAGAHAWRPPADAALFAPWPERGHEIERLLTLVDHLGLPRQGMALEFPVTAADREAARALLAGASVAGRRYVCVHVGAQLPSRRWHPRRFAEVADAVAERGRCVVLTGVDSEAPIVREAIAAMRHRPVNLCGRTTLWTLGALVEGAEAVVCNDTGMSHVAAALRRPSVVVSCGAEPARWAPLDRTRHRVLAHPVPCRPCMHAHCPYDHACATAVDARDVLRELALPA